MRRLRHRLRSVPLLVASLVLVPGEAVAQGALEASAERTESAPPQRRDALPRATIVTATRTPHELFDTPFSTDLVTAERIRERSYRTTPQALRDLPGVMVQETAPGQGSPYIRGFTGYRTVFLIDGIRLNNSVFRDGPNQYWNTVDQLSLERIELVKGPGSVLYGSDAIGGTVNALTRSPYTYGPGTNAGGRLYYRFASAEESHSGRGEASLTVGDSFGLLLGGSVKSFGDLHGGSDVGTQENTGYDEWDADFKLERFLDPHNRLVIAYQQVRQDDVPRTHSTIAAEPFEGTSVGSDLRRDLDQERQLAYVQLHGDGADDFFDRYTVSLSWQEQEEVEDRVRSSGARQLQEFDVGTLGFFAHLSSPTPIGRLTYGIDFYHDDVSSSGSSNPIQGPVADDSTYDLVGVFLQDEIDVTERLSLTIGGRFEHAAADAGSVLDPVTSERTSISDEWSSLVGSARFLYRLTAETVNLFGGVSQGFRAPNLSDLTRFDSARSNEFEVPAPGLDPERYVTYEVGVKTRQEAASAELAFFYTDIEDQIVRFPTGNTAPGGEFEITKDNVGDGYVYGIELGAAYRFLPSWTVFGLATFMEGKVETFPTSAPVVEEEPIDRLMPFTAELGLRWQSQERDLHAELLGIWADDADRLSTRDEGDTQRIPPGGTPGYFVLHANAGWQISRHATFDVAVDNLTNEDYRVHGSGSNMPGTNLIVGLTVRL